MIDKIQKTFNAYGIPFNHSLYNIKLDKTVKRGWLHKQDFLDLLGYTFDSYKAVRSIKSRT